MNHCSANFRVLFVFVFSMIVSISAHAMNNEHHHGDGAWGHQGYGGYVGPGYYPGWGGPNVIINVPVLPLAPRAPYYVRECETVEVCNQFDECWLERRCN